MVMVREEAVETEPCRYGLMSFFKNDNTVSRSLKEYGEWAQAEIEFLQALVPAMHTTLDIGAFIGTHTLALARLADKDGCIYAFEPRPAFFELLKKNVEQNGLSNVQLFQAALSDHVGFVDIPDIDIEDSRNFGGTAISEETGHVSGVFPSRRVHLTTVDKLGIEKCDLIKIDVENMEINVLRGAQETLQRTRPIVFAECHALHSGWPLVEFARAEGYESYLLNVPAFNPQNFRQNGNNFLGDLREAGFVFIPGERFQATKDRLDQVPYHSSLIPISSLDDLALALLKKPQYKEEVLSKTEAARILGVEFWANESQLRHSKQVVLDAERHLAEREALIKQLKTTRETHEQTIHGLQKTHQHTVRQLHQNYEKRIQELQSLIEQQVQQLEQGNAVLEQIYSSHGWRILSVYYRWRETLKTGAHRILALPLMARQGVSLLRDMWAVAGSGLFNRDWYLRENPDVAKAGVNPLRHYLRRGALEGRDPNPLFDTDWYMRQYPDVRSAGLNALRHYLEHGASEGRDPSPLFDSDWYLHCNPEVARAGLNPLVHYLQSGNRQGLDPRPSCDRERPVLRPEPIVSTVSSLAPPEQGRRRLVCVSHILPYPPRAGNEYRMHRMLSWLARRGFEIFSVICPLPDDPVTAERISHALEAYSNLVLCQRDGTILYRLAAGDTAMRDLAGVKPRPYGKLLGEEKDGVPSGDKILQIVKLFCPDVLAEVLLHLDRVLQPDVVLVDYVFMTRALPLLNSKATKIVDTNDVFSSKRDKVTNFGVADVLALSPQQEADLLERADLVIAIHSGEAEKLRRLVPDKRVVTAGVDFDFVDSIPQLNNDPVVLFVATDNAMNVKGLRDFLRFALPLVRREVPNIELRVIGSVGRALENDDPAVRILGQVEDLYSAYGEARLVINPAVAGTGLKIKTVEALCHLRPIVVWPSGVDGLAAEISQLCRVANNWYSFAEHVIDLCRTGDAAEAVISKRDMIREEFSADRVYRFLATAVGV